MRTKRRARGMTLIELMVAVGISSVILATATALVTTMSQVKRDSERIVEVRSGAVSALNIIQFDAVNAGFRFSSAPFAMRVLQNVDGTEVELAGVTATANCGDPLWGVALGTDVVDFFQGLPDAEPVDILSGTCAGSLCNIQVTVSRPSDPVNQSVVLLTDGTTSCVGKVSNAASPTFDIQLVRQDLTTNAVGGTYPGCSGALTGATRWRMMQLAQRTRYMVCAPPAASLDLKPALYRWIGGITGNFPAPLGNMVLIQEGVEDLQVAWRVADPSAELANPSCTGAGAARLCRCGGAAPTVCIGFEPSPTGGGILDAAAGAPILTRSAYLIRGVSIGVTAINLRPRSARTSTPSLDSFVRPALFDHAAGGVLTGDYRSSIETDLVFQNIVMVRP